MEIASSKFEPKEYARAWRTANRESQNAYKRTYYQENRERIRAKARAWYQENKERIAAKRRVNYEATLEKERSQQRKWSAKKPRWWALIGSARARAKKAGLPFDLDHEWAEKRWTGRCELTGIEFSAKQPGGPGMFSPSIDRIVPERGYVKDNCRFILHAVNSFRQNGTDAQMVEIAKALIANAGAVK